MKRFIKIIGWLFILSIIFLTGFFTGKSNRNYTIDSSVERIKRSVTSPISDAANLNGRKLVLLENPELIDRIMEGGSFGNENFSIAAAQNMFSKDDDAMEDIIQKSETIQVKPNIWFIRLPLVNCTLIETADGLVLIDTGMKPAGPALLKAIRGVSNKPIHTIIYTHGHVDHSYGTWAVIEAGENPQIIAQNNIKKRFERYLKLRGSIGKYMSQPIEQLPDDPTDIVWPTHYFEEELTLNIGGITFELKHFKGETDDQLFVWLPNEKVLAAADYYQGFLPNAGNGKRVQRYVEEWTEALLAMADLRPDLMLPSHGEYIDDPKLIRENLLLVAEAFSTITTHTIKGLNSGLRKDQIFESCVLPEHLRDHPLLEEKYVSAKDISKMLIKQYTGWWNDIPSYWAPAPLELQAEKIVELAGGIDQLVSYSHGLMYADLVLASHFADWAYFADPYNSGVQQLVLDVYRARIMSEESVTQEMLVYLDHMSKVREEMKR